MPKNFGRNCRVAQFIQKELAFLIQREFPIKEYGMVTVSEVSVSPDLKNAVVFITSFAADRSNEEITHILNDKSAHFRHEISHLMRSKSVPVLKFKYDDSMERAQRLGEILYSVKGKSLK